MSINSEKKSCWKFIIQTNLIFNSSTENFQKNKMGLEKMIGKAIGKKIATQILDTNNDGKLDFKGIKYWIISNYSNTLFY